MIAATCEPAARWGLAFFDISIPASHLSQALEHPESLQTAMELGRLDFISVMLTIFGVFVGVAAVLSFGYVIGAAKDKAKDETKLYLDAHLSVVCLPHVEKYLGQYMSTVMSMSESTGEGSPDWGGAVDPGNGNGGQP